jgi:ribonuclease P protein component
MIFLPSDDLKFAFVVSKKVGNAVIRNRTKRRFRAIARNLALEKGWFLFLAKPSIKDAEFSNIKKDIDKCLYQLKQ